MRDVPFIGALGIDSASADNHPRHEPPHPRPLSHDGERGEYDCVGDSRMARAFTRLFALLWKKLQKVQGYVMNATRLRFRICSNLCRDAQFVSLTRRMLAMMRRQTHYAHESAYFEYSAEFY